MHFPVIIKLQFGKECHTLLCILKLFTNRTVPTNSKVFLRGLLNIREKQILTSVIEM